MAALVSNIESAVGSVISIPNTSASSSASSAKTQTSESRSRTRTASEKDQDKASGSQIPSSTHPLVSAATSTSSSNERPTQTSSAKGQESSILSSVSAKAQQANINDIQTKTTASSKSASTASSSITETQEAETEQASSTITSFPQTTLATSTTSSSSLSLSITQAPATSAAAGASPTNIQTSTGKSGIPVAGIVVASVMGFLALLTVLFLIFRYCGPVRRKYDAWQEQKRLARTYRPAIDGIDIPESKLDRDGSPYAASFQGRRFYDNGELNTNPQARGPGAQGAGLGLGSRLSILMQHSPFQLNNSGVRQSQIGMAVSNSRYNQTRGPLPW